MRARQRKVKTMPSSAYVAEAINCLLDSAYSSYLEFCSLLDQLEDRLPLKEQKEGWLSDLNMTKELLTMKFCVESLRRNDCDCTLTQIGQETCRRARACICAVSARYGWYVDHITWIQYTEHSYKHSVDDIVDALIEALRKIENAGRVLKEADKPEFVRVCQLRKYIETLSEDESES